MSSSGADDVPLAALDLGYSSALFVVAVAGRPVFCRVLRNCGLGQFVRQLEEGLALSPEECGQLLARVGISESETGVGRGGSAAQGIRQLVAAPLGDLLGELERTWNYLGQQYSKLHPERLYLLGGGAAIRHLTDQIANRLEVPTHIWSLRREPTPQDAADAVFGVAAALSAAAWENA
jgi:Tfp pilus assembly PilM family ATPase